MIDVIKILDACNTPYITKGNNVTDGDINIKCPFCGNDDPSEHCGINPNNGVWGCWRNAEHRGKGLTRLIQKLIHCSVIEAEKLISSYSIGVLVPIKRIKTELVEETLPSNFAEITRSGIYEKFYNYLIRRNFNKTDIINVCKRYQLKGCLSGDYRYRLIIPYYDDYTLLGWTGRSIRDGEKLRYKTSNKQIKKTLYNLNNVSYDTVIITEGPFDAIKLDFYGQFLGVNAVAVSGLSISDRQYSIIWKLANEKKVYVLFDKGTFSKALQLKSKISNIQILQMPENYDDAGEFSSFSVISLIQNSII